MKHTKGEWYLHKHIGVTKESVKMNKLTPIYYQNVCDKKFPGGRIIAKCLSKDKDELQVNAKLIAEAGNVANETGHTPRQLAEQKAELLEALKEITKGEGRFDMDRLIHASNTIEDMKSIANEAIKKATK